VEARADTTTSPEALLAWEDLLRRSLVEEAAITTSMDLLAVPEGLVRSPANSLEEAATTTSNIPVTTTMDRQEAPADLQAWPARSWAVAAHLAVINLAELSTALTRIMVTLEVAAHTAATLSNTMAAATSNTVVEANNTMDPSKITAAAVAEGSSAASWVVASQTATPVAMAIHQEAAPAAPTLALRHPLRTSLRDRLATANLVNTANLVKATAPTLARHLRASHRRLALITRRAETHRTDNNLTVHRRKADMEVSSSRAPTVDLPSNSMVATTKVLVAMDSHKETTASPKVAMADSSLLLEVTEVEDMSSSMATAATEDDLSSRTFFFLDIET
jgi:hypothetical protein